MAGDEEKKNCPDLSGKMNEPASATTGASIRICW
jgi:hypothetical protein